MGDIQVYDEESHIRMSLKNGSDLRRSLLTYKITGTGGCITNLDPSITLRLDETTNWTGVNHDGQELGYVATNHVAVIYYQGATNEFTLKTTASEIAKWRKVQPLQWIITTNQMQPFIWPGGSGLTNIPNVLLQTCIRTGGDGWSNTLLHCSTMNPCNFPEANTKYGPPPGMDESQVMTIPAYVGTICGGSVDGSLQVIVAWKPDAAELAQLNSGAPVFLSMMGGLMPHFLTVNFEAAKHPA